MESCNDFDLMLPDDYWDRAHFIYPWAIWLSSLIMCLSMCLQTVLYILWQVVFRICHISLKAERRSSQLHEKL
jgi:hypothetical protein